MSSGESLWREVNQYVEGLFVKPDNALNETLKRSRQEGLPEIEVSPAEGKLLYLLAGLARPKRILEIGLLGGYSTIWLARTLPVGGKLVSLEISEKHASTARKNIELAGLAERVETRMGPALATLERMVTEKEEPFDVVFIDANKEEYPAYLDWSLKLVKPGSLILADNVILNGGVANPEESAPDPLAVREFNRKLAENPRLDAIIVPIMREKFDGVAIARVLK